MEWIGKMQFMPNSCIHDTGECTFKKKTKHWFGSSDFRDCATFYMISGITVIGANRIECYTLSIFLLCWNEECRIIWMTNDRIMTNQTWNWRYNTDWIHEIYAMAFLCFCFCTVLQGFAIQFNTTRNTCDSSWVNAMTVDAWISRKIVPWT